jgi:hypothetical protein
MLRNHSARHPIRPFDLLLLCVSKVAASVRTIGTRRRLAALVLTAIAGAASACASSPGQTTLPTHLSDEEFWNLSTGLSEPPGVFRHSDNLVSNEDLFAYTIQIMRERGGVYIGVGPEQNFSYIARVRPAMAFIIDIRQQNRNLHLLYKALFETSLDRADFASRLFSRERPAGLGANTSVQELFTAYANVPASSALFEARARLVRQTLIEQHRFPISPDDLQSIDAILGAFYSDGPDIHYGRSLPATAAGPSYRSLMVARDVRGQARSYLASEEAFAFVKDLHARNLIVPVTGDFAGPGAIRRTGDYIRKHGGIVSAFYASNVEVYLSKQQMAAFCRNLESLPYEPRTWFIRGKGLQPLETKLQTCPRAPVQTLQPILPSKQP